MLGFLLAFGVWIHALFWGTGIAWFAMPSRWRRFWPVVALLAGLTLQSVVVWLGALLDLRGTNAYALPAELIPLGLLVLALLRAGFIPLCRDLLRTSGLLAVSAFTLIVLVFPSACKYHGLTTGSLGSCDAADYAGGARSFMEFARSDRVGFMGLPEVTRVMSIDHFFDFYLRLMHFSPCAIIALNGTIFGCAPHEIIGVLTALALASAVPVVFWISRDLMGLRSMPSIIVALLFGLSPVNWYAVYQGAMAQLLAAQAIGLLTWASWSLWRHGSAGTKGWSYCAILLVAYALILGSYSFIIVVCLVPALALAGGMAIAKRQYDRFLRWLMWILAPLAAAMLLFLPRVLSILERFTVFKKYDEGWKIPYLWPEGWLGIVKGPLLHPVGEPYRIIAMGLLVAAFAVTFVGLKSRRRQLLYRSICLAAPSLLGCFYLNWRGIHWGHGENRSYLAYKLFCVFYPGILPSLSLWMLFFLFLLGLLLFGVLRVDLRFEQVMASPPLVVDRQLLDIRSVEANPDVPSLNIMIPDMWSRLWANSFLLKKPHYFPIHSYEGRLNTLLRGQWDLNGGMIKDSLPRGDSRPINDTFSLANTKSPYFVRVSLGAGWHEPEHIPHTSIHWIWSRGDSSIQILNPHTTPLRISLQFRLRSKQARDIRFWIQDTQIGEVTLGNEIRSIEIQDVVIKPGVNQIELRSSLPPSAPNRDDSRPLGFALSGIIINVPEASNGIVGTP